MNYMNSMKVYTPQAVEYYQECQADFQQED